MKSTSTIGHILCTGMNSVRVQCELDAVRTRSVLQRWEEGGGGGGVPRRRMNSTMDAVKAMMVLKRAHTPLTPPEADCTRTSPLRLSFSTISFHTVCLHIPTACRAPGCPCHLRTWLEVEAMHPLPCKKLKLELAGGPFNILQGMLGGLGARKSKISQWQA